MAVTISQVEPGSLAERKRLRPGDRLIALNGHEIADVLDYRFYLQETRLRLTVQRGDKLCLITLYKKETDDIGLDFETYLMDKQHACRNKCVFCFIDQLPPGMRESLYFKDDDDRLSFLFGNYITLTNLSEREIDRIVSMHISPIHLSVHTTDPALRCRMMGNRFAGNCLAIMERFAQAGIRMECQLVVCPELNDGAALQRSMEDLARLAPAVESVAIVPVGLTRYRDGLYPLRGFTKEEAGAVLDLVEAFGDRQLKQTGNRLVYPADEWYIKAARPMPEEDFYGEMSQLENGVGMTALLTAQFEEALRGCDRFPAGTPTTLATGVAAAPILEKLVDEARKKWHNLDITIRAIKNHFFGETIDVAGLITGSDLIDQLTGCCARRLLIPRVMLCHDGARFLDDVTPAQVEQALGTTLKVVGADGADLVEALLG